MSKQLTNKLCAYGFCSDPISYAIETMDFVENLIGQEKRIDICRQALQEYQDEQNKIASDNSWRSYFGRYLITLGKLVMGTE